MNVIFNFPNAGNYPGPPHSIPGPLSFIPPSVQPPLALQAAFVMLTRDWIQILTLTQLLVTDLIPSDLITAETPPVAQLGGTPALRKGRDFIYKWSCIVWFNPSCCGTVINRLLCGKKRNFFFNFLLWILIMTLLSLEISIMTTKRNCCPGRDPRKDMWYLWRSDMPNTSGPSRLEPTSIPQLNGTLVIFN